jgi:hypothetical protein
MDVNSLDLIQRSPEWFAIRLGKLTSSGIAPMLARRKSGGWSSTRQNYLVQLMLERLTGAPAGSDFQSKAMADGIEREPLGKAAYEFEKNATIQPVGFVPHPRIGMSGSSPDGFVGERGVVEFKSPIPATHWATLHAKKSIKPVDEEYVNQMQWHLACTGRQWCDFVSFCPEFPPTMQLVDVRCYRDARRIAELESAALTFLAEVAKAVAEAAADHGVQPCITI